MHEVIEPEEPVRFGTFTGVFTPTLLTILGVIMYVRMGWVVGNAGLMGSFLILGLAMAITTCTGLSLSSIATNTRIGGGGPYAIMNKSLGLEVGTIYRDPQSGAAYPCAWPDCTANWPGL